MKYWLGLILCSNFKSTPHLASNPNDRNVPVSVNGTPKTAKEPQLGQFAKMILNNTDISFRCRAFVRYIQVK